VSRRHRASFLALAAGLVAAAVLSGCGVPTEGAAQVVSGLPPLSTTPTTSPKPGVLATVYWVVSGTALERVQVTVPAGSSLTTVIGVLLGGPTTTKVLHTQLGSYLTNVKLLHSSQTKTLVTVNFSGNFSQISGQAEVLAVAQVVYTVASFNQPDQTVNPTIKVVFQVDGALVAVPEGTGTSTSAPVTIKSYSSLVATRPAT
jgi:spore germination protein GerM